MKKTIERWILSRPAVRQLLEENERLRAALAELQTEEVKQPEKTAPDSKLWVPPGHFYSPLVDPAEPSVVQSMLSEAHPTVPPASFGISEEEMLHWFHVIAKEYARRPFPEKPAAGLLYYYSNPNFPLADALALQGFMLSGQPGRYIEIGSGFSSCAAIDINDRYLGGGVDMTFIEPHPELALELIGADSPYRNRFLKSKLQDVPLDVFQSLGKGDILFIDSSHVAKTGSDVLDYLFRVLPCLAPHVLVHVHDIFYPFEYPKDWIADQNRSWNEAYFLRAFLQGNPMFRVLYMSDFFYKCRRDLVAEKMPLCIAHRGGSVWMETQPLPF